MANVIAFIVGAASLILLAVMLIRDSLGR